MNNIENKIKKEFQQQEIKPSKQSWENLSRMLDAKEEQKSKKGIIFFKYAAVFIGLLVAASFFLKENNSVEKINKNNLELVNTVPKNIDNSQEIIIVKTSEKEKLNQVIKNDKTNTSVANNKIKQKSSVKIKTSPINTSLLALNSDKNNELSKKNIQEQIINDVEVISNPIAVQEKQKINNSEIIKTKHHKELMNSSDEDIENMLRLALNTSESKKHLVKINNDSLQLAIENNLYKNKSTKYKIYKVIKTGVDTVESLIVSNKN